MSQCAALAIDWSGPGRQPCPLCNRGQKDRSLGVTVEPDGRGVAHCFRCGHVQTIRGEVTSRRSQHVLPHRPAAKKRRALSPYGRQLWESCVPLDGASLAYLQARQCVIPPPGGHLRCHPRLKHWPSSTVGPALVGLVTDAVTGEPLTLHRTWVQSDGKKAPLDEPRMVLKDHDKVGGVVRLWPDEAVTVSLGIAEGIETALSLAHAFSPVWALLDAGNLASMPVLDGVESLLIAADHDAAGIAAAKSCGQRWAARGREARIVMSDVPKADLNDMVRAA